MVHPDDTLDRLRLLMAQNWGERGGGGGFKDPLALTVFRCLIILSEACDVKADIQSYSTNSVALKRLLSTCYLL